MSAQEEKTEEMPSFQVTYRSRLKYSTTITEPTLDDLYYTAQSVYTETDFAEYDVDGSETEWTPLNEAARRIKLEMDGAVSTHAQPHTKQIGFSPLAWKMLECFFQARNICSFSIPSWSLGTAAGGDAASIQAIPTKIHPRNKYERALKELLDAGLVKELEDLSERFTLVVKEGDL